MITTILLATGFGVSTYLAITRPSLRQLPPPPQCSCTTDSDGILRCEGLPDPRCAAACCPRHCVEFCKERCASRASPGNIVQCSSANSPYGSARCIAKTDPRCDGGNCSDHCKQHCKDRCNRKVKRLR